MQVNTKTVHLLSIWTQAVLARQLAVPPLSQQPLVESSLAPAEVQLMQGGIGCSTPAPQAQLLAEFFREGCRPLLVEMRRPERGRELGHAHRCSPAGHYTLSGQVILAVATSFLVRCSKTLMPQVGDGASFRVLLNFTIQVVFQEFVICVLVLSVHGFHVCKL